MNFKSVLTLKPPTQMVQFTFLSNIYAICNLFHQFREKIGVTWVIFEWSYSSDHFTRYAVTLRLVNKFQKARTNYHRLQLPVHAREKNMFRWPIKIQSFDNQTSKFTCPLDNVLAPLRQTLKGKQSQSLLFVVTKTRNQPKPPKTRQNHPKPPTKPTKATKTT